MKIKFYFLVLCLCGLISCNGEDKAKTPEEIITLQSAPITTKLFYSGIIQPLKTIVVTAPSDGVIQEMLFHYGEIAKKGALLFKISSEKFQTDYKNALMQFVKAKNEFNTSHSQLLQSEFLHKNQLISNDEYKSKKNAYYTAQLSLLQAEDSLNVMLKQLRVQGFKVNELTIENIDKITEALKSQGESRELLVFAPTDGMVLLPMKSDGEGEVKKIGKGDQVKQGDVLAQIGDTKGYSLRINVNEFNINQLQVGQKVKVVGAAFPDFVLQGKISGLDRQAQSSSSGMPVFSVEIVIPTLSGAEQKLIHIGMSAKVEINLEGPPQISVPIAAVFEKNGKTFVNAIDARSGKKHEVLVRTGQTSFDSVVIESALHSGDKIVFTR